MSAKATDSVPALRWLWLVLLMPNPVHAQQRVGGGPHDLNPRFAETGRVCWYCHAPHVQRPARPMWNRDDPGVTYSVYETPTMQAETGQPSGSALMCLSCHDGTIAPNQTVLDRRRGRGSPPVFITGDALLGTDLKDDHPISITYPTSERMHQPPPPELTLENGRVQCISCHDPHDNTNGSFLVLANQRSLLCSLCHRSDPGWTMSSHATSMATWSGAGPDPWGPGGAATVEENACGNCHRAHGTGSSAWLLLRGGEEATCIQCHDGNVASTDVWSDIQRPYRHPVDTFSGEHSPQESALVDPAFGINRHVECTDCHHPHSAGPDDPLGNIQGVGSDGSFPKNVSRESELCYRCHGDSSDKPGLEIQRVANENNTRLEFGLSAISRHPVEGPLSVPLEVPSLREPWVQGATMSCGDCHGSGESRSAGGQGPEGPHGSAFRYLLKRQYNTGHSPQNSPARDQALCAECHNLDSILQDASMAHSRHTERLSCSVCHDPHGIAAGTTDADPLRNRRLINFDTGFALPLAGESAPWWEDLDPQPGQFTGTCHLACHIPGGEVVLHDGSSTYQY